MKNEIAEVIKIAKQEYIDCLQSEYFKEVIIEEDIKESPKGNNITITLTAKIKVEK